jgi:hypothetical protein
MAVSFIPLVGPLISCIIDGTFVDMIKALSTGDWATLGMCALSFVPGAGKLAKLGVKSVEKGGAQILKNRAVGKAFEKSVIGKLGLSKGGRLDKVGNMKTYRVADAFDSKGNLVEIKHVKQLRITDQTRDQFEWARASGKKVYFACDAGYATNVDAFSATLTKKYGSLFGGMLLV